MKQSMHRIKEQLCGFLDEIAQKGDIGTGDLQMVHMITETYKNIVKITMLEEGGQYSSSGNSWADGMYSGRRYSMADTYEGTQPSYRYARGDGKEQIKRLIMERMDGADVYERQKLQKAMDALG